MIGKSKRMKELEAELARHNRFVVGVKKYLLTEGYEGLARNCDELAKSYAKLLPKD